MARCRRSCPPAIRRLLRDVVNIDAVRADASDAAGSGEPVSPNQLALYREHGVKPRRPDPETRAVLVLFSPLVDWRSTSRWSSPNIVLGLSVSPDGETILYARFVGYGSDLMMQRTGSWSSTTARSGGPSASRSLPPGGAA